MKLTISDFVPEELERLKNHMEKRFPAAAPETESGRCVYHLSLNEEDGVALMGELLKAAPEVTLWGSFVFGVEGRDPSWWREVTYCSKKDENGVPVVVCKGSHTDWA